MERKAVHGMMLLLVLSSMLTLAFTVQPLKAVPTTIWVPDDYLTIQEAVNATGEGDTIRVKAGTYIEEVVIQSKHGISLIGDDASSTVIRNKVYDQGWCDGVVEVRSSTAVLIKGFTITPSLDPLLNATEAGIYLWSDSYDCTIMNCVVANFNNTLIAGTFYGIRLDGTQCTVRRNIIRNNCYGIYSYNYDGNSNNRIYGNVLMNNTYYGIYCSHYMGNGNNIAMAYGNNIANNMYGVCCYKSINNKFHHNNFIDNTHAQAYPSGYVQIWDDGDPSGGNYWTDYFGVDSDHDGIGDTQHVIDYNNQDNYPLMAPIAVFDAGTWDEVSYSVDVVSNSTVSDFYFNPDEGAFIRFNITGPVGTAGFSRAGIPKELLWVENGWVVLVGEEPVVPTVTADVDHTYLYFTYSHSTRTVEIQGTNAIPEFPTWTTLLLILTVVTVAFTIYKRRLLKTLTH